MKCPSVLIFTDKYLKNPFIWCLTRLLYTSRNVPTQMNICVQNVCLHEGPLQMR